MIGKIGRNGNGFRGLVSYLVDGKTKGQKDPNRVAWLAYRNLETEDPKVAIVLMRGTATLSARCEKPVYHFVVSWRADENPTPELMREVGDVTLSDMGLGDHQVMMVAHTDTDHQHLHFVVNRVHPDSCKAWHTGKDYARLEQSIGRQARERGLLFVEGRHNTPDKAATKPRRVKPGEYRFAERCGTAAPLNAFSLNEIKRRREELAPLFAAATSWDQLNALVKARGLTMLPKGQGVILADANGFMKLSDLGKDIRLPALEKQFAEPFKVYHQRRAVQERDQVERVQAQRDLAATSLTPAADAKPRQSKPKASAAGDAQSAKPKRKPIPLPPLQAIERLKNKAEDQNPEVVPPINVMRQPDPTLWAKPDEGTGETAQNFIKRFGSTVSKPAVVPDPRGKAFESLGTAHSALDLTQQFAAMGLASSADVKRAEDNLRRAREDVEQHQTFSEFVRDGVSKALTPKPNSVEPIPPSTENDTDREEEDEHER